MELSSRIYQILMKCYQAAPLKPQIAKTLRWLPIPIGKFYKDLKFRGEFEVLTDSGTFLINHLETTIENEIFWKGLDHAKERSSVRLWQHFSKGASVIFDVGANTGLYSLISKVENPKSKVVAFEPSKKLFPELLSNIKLNEFEIHCEKLAISNKLGDATFYDFPANFPSSGSLSRDMVSIQLGETVDKFKFTVPCETIDNYLTSNSISKLDLMKIDVEMHEAEVFEGFTRLQEFRPIIIVEILRNEIAKKIASSSDLSGYRFFRLFGINGIEEVDSLSIAEEHGNLLLLPNEKSLPNIPLV